MVEMQKRSSGVGYHYSPIYANQRITRPNQEKSSFRHTNEFVKPFSRPSFTSTSYSKKLPISFVSAKDWRLYINFSHKVRTRGQITPRSRVSRLLNSFLRLYQEYSYVCDKILLSQSLHIDNNNVQLSSNERRFEESTKEMNDQRNFFDRSDFGEFLNMTKYNGNGSMKRWFINKLHPFRLRKFSNTKPYDRIRPPHHEIIEIYTNEEMRRLISHRISFTGFDSIGHPMIKWIQVPIALELLIPKVQLKIKRIMISCNFLYDPLEVAAELRYFNYNVEQCISHFHRTRKFRDILEEFLPQDSQLKELENKPQLYQNLQHFLDDICNDEIVTTVRNGSVNVNRTNCNSSACNKGDFIKPKRYDKPQSGDQFRSQVQSKLIKVIGAVEKLKLSRIEIHEFLDKCTAKYKRQIVEYSKMIVHITESLKEFLMTDEQRGRVLHLLKQNDELKIKLKEEENKRKTIYNLMQDQLGNVRVYCRCRAMDRQQNVLDVKTNDTISVQVGFCEEYKFDKVFEPFRTQADIYEELQPLILSFIDGFNVCFITYGGEASGKTYTLLGPQLPNVSFTDLKKHDGIMKRALCEVLSEEVSRQRDWDYQLSGSIVEIYNDSYTDLLAEKVGVHLPIDGGLEKVQEALKSMSINSESDVENLIKVCKMKRKVGRTALNPHSSRSHLITMIHLTGRSKIHGERISSFLGLCDLAGFEDILKAETHNSQTLSKEAGYINKSLTAFNRMFTSLRRQDPNSVSYRDTRLTYLLKPFLTNQGKCILIVTVRTDKSSISSTQSTLRFGRESRGVALGKARRQTNIEKVQF